ncbi:SAF domain-containing protein [Acidipropionibacterium acidipropionici ATCC 4875]|uniref:SAF domain-containing protein n=2 Tax=Acidipropionibacterium acidipropionici TaxID=1748 RepID=K7RSX6_ACIA4|nr:SAF domain-containing protein [Acidipropionibacterium acidipropionici ATCC 4875]
MADAPRLRTRRSPVLIVAGLLCAVLGALGGAFAWTQASRAQSVLVMARDVARGEQLRSGDVGVVSISVAEGVSTLPASELDRLIGGHAKVDLPAGSLLGAGFVGALPITPGTARVGLRLPAGRVPTSPMPAGTRISVVEVAEKSETQASGTQRDAEKAPRSTDAVVVRAPVRAEDRASWLLDVEVNADQAPRLADLASRDRVAVIVRGP